jgi:response regulator RpfG family c-di-GMP phosphodiesterase
MLRNSVLFVDDEVNILHALRRLFVDYHLNIVTAESAFKAMDILKYTDISVIVCDNFMPGMKGIYFLEKAKLISPDSVKIMMTAHADLSVAVDAINKGEVYKVVTKPWDDEELKNTMLDALDRFNIIHSMRNASEGALLSLAQTIELKDPYTRGHCERVAQYAVAVAIALGFKEEQKRDLRCGSYLHDCGKIGVPEAILNLSSGCIPRRLRRRICR